MCGRVPGVTQTQSKAQTRNVADAFTAGGSRFVAAWSVATERGSYEKRKKAKVS